MLDSMAVAADTGERAAIIHKRGPESSGCPAGIRAWLAVVSVAKLYLWSIIRIYQDHSYGTRGTVHNHHFAGTQTPTFRDRGRNPIVDDWPGQMDCIDESTNTKRYLDLLQVRGLLRWHRAADRAYRTPYLFDPHWAGQIIELETQQSYVVDSWHLDNGNPPYIQALNKWLRKAPFEE